MNAAIGLTVIDDDGAVHARSWNVPPSHAATFADYMTSQFGAPDEMITDAETMEAAGLQAVTDGSAVYLAGMDGGSHG